MSLQIFRTALSSKLGEVITPELAAWLEENAFDRIDLSHNPDKFGKKQYGGLTFQLEHIADIVDEIHPLHQAHWLETEKHRQGIAMQPDYEAFKTAERAGQLLQFTARDETGLLVGNIRMYLYTSLHSQTLCAREDTIYMLPKHRTGWTAVRFWQFMEKSLQVIGVREITTDSKLSSNIDRFNKYLGYAHIANTFHKFLGE